jgi:hypothetical protein
LPPNVRLLSVASTMSFPVRTATAMDMKLDLLLGAAELTEIMARVLVRNVQSKSAHRHATRADSASPRT